MSSTFQPSAEPVESMIVNGVHGQARELRGAVERDRREVADRRRSRGVEVQRSCIDREVRMGRSRHDRCEQDRRLKTPKIRLFLNMGHASLVPVPGVRAWALGAQSARSRGCLRMNARNSLARRRDLGRKRHPRCARGRHAVTNFAHAGATISCGARLRTPDSTRAARGFRAPIRSPRASRDRAPGARPRPGRDRARRRRGCGAWWPWPNRSTSPAAASARARTRRARAADLGRGTPRPAANPVQTVQSRPLRAAGPDLGGGQALDRRRSPTPAGRRRPRRRRSPRGGRSRAPASAGLTSTSANALAGQLRRERGRRGPARRR